MRISSILAVGALVLGATVLPVATAEAAAETPAQKCARYNRTHGIFIQATGGTLCLSQKGPGYWVADAYGCGPLRSGGRGYVVTARGTRISCNGWVNFAHTTVTFHVQ
ncbi:hypothetical protein [Allokutzneria albata]|uniref:Alpha amylase inhibitor n=1 Tax=Allokutzneria albata TaxID=211114 RepID=A0A1G9UPZ2_ALLAB|nr:hypothetical protein [Allokutzneria albata]SDM61936.1 hypothetical protein SAMN04489726_2542 [Allokutzneria albata]